MALAYLPPWPLPVWLGLLVLVLVAVVLAYDVSLWWRMPPGPTPLPFLGNKLQLAPSQPWVQFEQWSRVYGPIFTVWIGRRPTVVVSDAVVAAELMEGRSAKYSSRPRMVAMGELLWDGASILVQPYGKSWSVRRRLLHLALAPKALKLYKPVQEAEAARLAHRLQLAPDAWVASIETFTSSVVFCVAYGHRIDSLHAGIIHQRFRLMQYSASLNVPGRYLVEVFPLLKHVPDALAPWKREIREHGREEADANMALVRLVRDDMACAAAAGRPDSVPDSLCKLLLEQDEKTPIALSERDFSFIPASLFGAGSDTTASTLCSAFLALVTHPHTLRAVQAELDAVVGPNRAPTFADEDRLPYLGALVKEVLRWRPVAVLGGTPHASTEDDRYRGYLIPRGTTVLGNSWAINLNPQYYPDPHRFEPRRFLAETLADKAKQPDGPLGRPHPSRSGHSSFGWGRRICPGAGLATNSLFIALAKMLWAYDILPVAGVRYDTFAYTEGFNIRPQPFTVTIQVRSDAHRAVLEQENAQAQAYLKKFSPFA